MKNQSELDILNPRHRLFARLVAEGKTATDAYLEAGYRAAKRETVHRNAARLRCQPKVREYICRLSREGEELAREATTFTVAQKLEFLAKLVLTGARAAKPEDDFVQYHREFKDGSTATRLPCKLKALQLHSRLAGHFDPIPPKSGENTDNYDVHVVMGEDIEPAHQTEQGAKKER